MSRDRFISLWRQETGRYFAKNYHPDITLQNLDEVPPQQTGILLGIFNDVAAVLPNNFKSNLASDFRDSIEEKLLDYPEEQDRYTTPIYSGYKTAVKKFQNLESV